MAVHIFIALVLLHLKNQQEFLTAQATLKRNEFVCRAKRKRIAKKARALLFRPVLASQTVYIRKVASPTRVTLPAEARQLTSPSCLALPSYLTHLM